MGPARHFCPGLPHGSGRSRRRRAVAVISQTAEKSARINLAKVEEPYELRVETKRSEYNIHPGRARRIQ